MIDFIKNTIVEAAQILNTTSLTIEKNKDNQGNWVTQADLAIEKFIVSKIKENYPDDFILSEETSSELPKTIPERMWVIDPLDGTTNATCGLPHYGISLAYLEKGRPAVGGIYDLSQKKLFLAKTDAGATCNNQPLRIKDRSLRGSLVCIGSPYKFDNFVKEIQPIKKIHQAGARLIILGSAVIAAMYTATNTFSVYYEYQLKPWDVAAAAIIIKEAGGVVKGDNHQELNILKPDLFVCGNKQSVKELFSFI